MKDHKKPNEENKDFNFEIWIIRQIQLEQIRQAREERERQEQERRLEANLNRVREELDEMLNQENQRQR